ncbi:MAG TPA: hypothetical protein VKZ18_20340 [Polyangia bacterium]|nr:hypothetical protein [Polyangia bacterium]
MRSPGKGACLSALGVVAALAATPAHAADGSLLVVIEAPPALGADAAEIRRAIGAELRVSVAAPTQTASDRSERALIVALERDRIAMSLRASDAAPTVRVIPAPADHAAWLHAIAWLAGNLARDQVSPIIAQMPPESPPAATAPALPASLPATEPPPAPPATPPAAAPAAPPPLPDFPPGPAIAVRVARRTPPSPLRWSVTGSIGPLVAGLGHQSSYPWSAGFGLEPSTMWQIAVQRRRERERLVVGGALEGTYNNSGNGVGPQLIGAEVFVGADWPHKYCTLEATIGAGPEAASTVGIDTYTAMNGGFSSGTYVTYYLDLFARGSVAATVPLSGALEGVLQLGAHLNASRNEQWFAASTIGVRYTLP